MAWRSHHTLLIVHGLLGHKERVTVECTDRSHRVGQNLERTDAHAAVNNRVL